MIESLFSCPSSDIAVRVFGVKHRHIEIISRGLDITITPRGLELILCGEEENVNRALDLFGQLRDTIERGHAVYEADVQHAINSLSQNGKTSLGQVLSESVLKSFDGKTIATRTENQLTYVNALRNFDLVFGVGPAGTGKTYLAMAMALSHFAERHVRRIILTRPAVEAGEKLGFLPGDLEQKVNPYLRPLYDALFEMFDRQRAKSLLTDGTIEVAPMGFMRGRTLKDAFIILDEAQNTTPAQMKMFLTRIGEGSMCVINGDISQIDLPVSQQSGLVQAINYLKDVEGIAICRFTRDDVIRHPLVQRIIDAYDAHEN
ncbi:PhoH family protein [Myxococcota bacterium]|nr:PhoH family protein [Myxococcota bacterium]